jgi:predicted methyltransferase
MNVVRLWVVALAIAGAASDAQSQNAISPMVAQALANPARAADVPTDARRKAGELVTFTQVKKGDVVVDLIPGNGYFTRLFSEIAGPSGRVYALWPAEYAREAGSNVTDLEKMSKTKDFSNVTVISDQPAAKFSVPTPIDVMWTSQNYHDYPDKFMGSVDPVAFDRAVFNALKPGGVFVVVDHVADAGSGMRDTDTLHRIDPDIVKKQVTSVGFVFDGETDVLRNPADTHKLKVFDPSIRGNTDQFAFRFRKPANAAAPNK